MAIDPNSQINKPPVDETFRRLVEESERIREEQFRKQGVAVGTLKVTAKDNLGRLLSALPPGSKVTIEIPK
jgi:hypothetical protein